MYLSFDIGIMLQLAMWCGIMIGIAGEGVEVELMIIGGGGIEVEFPSVACFDGPTREV